VAQRLRGSFSESGRFWRPFWRAILDAIRRIERRDETRANQFISPWIGSIRLAGPSTNILLFQVGCLYLIICPRDKHR